MITKKITMFVVMMAAAVIVAAPTVKDVTAKQRYPWNGLVDITCTVSGIEGTTNGLKFAVAAVSQDPGDARKCSNFWVMQNGGKTIDRKVHTNGNYRLLWDAGADLGTGIYSNIVVRIAIRSVTADKVQLWEGGPYWATTNIGADEPWEYGYYFWWGDTIGYKRENGVWVASDGSTPNLVCDGSSFKENDVPTYGKNISTLRSEGWITLDNALVLEHDAAYKHWGDGWRMPTDRELSDLDTKCDRTWTFVNGVGGCVISGRGDYASASIFLPAETGFSSGFYWSSVPHLNSAGMVAWDLRVHPGPTYPEQPDFRFHSRTRGQAIRPVRAHVEAMVAAVVIAGDSAPFLLDTHAGVRESAGDETLTYSSLWDGGNGATVTIAQDGAMLVEGLTGEGERAWSVTRNGTYVLTHTTYTNGVAGQVETATFVVTGKDVPFAEGDVSVSGYEAKYDGTAHGIGVTVASGIENVALKYAVGDGTPTLPWGTEPPTLTDAGSMTVWCEIAAPGYITQTNSATVTISKRAVTLTSGSASKVYDGTALVKHEVAVGGDGFVAGEGASYNFTGSQIGAGSSANSFTYALGANTKAGNYAIETVNGSLTVAKATYDMSGAKWDYAGEFKYDGGQKTVLVTGLPAGVTVSAYSGNTGSAPGTYTAHVEFLYDTTNYDKPEVADLVWVIRSAEETKLKEIFEDLPAAIEPDGASGWTVKVTNDIDSADLPIEIPDNLGKVTIDLNGHDLSGADGADGDDTTPGGAGQPAIVIVSGDGEGDPTELSIVTTGGDAAVNGGDGGDGNPGGSGAPAIAVADDANDGVLVNVGEGVTVRGGDGGASDSGDGGNGGAGIAGNVGTNDGTIIGGSGGSSVSGDGGNGGPGVDGNVDVNNGAISGGASGGSESGEHGSHGEGVTGEVGTDNGVILPYALADEMVGQVAGQPFTGAEVKPVPDVYDSVHGRDMVEGVDYVLSWKDNIWPGTASVTVTGIGDYVGLVTRTFTIGTPVELTLKAGEYFKATLAELGYDVPTDGTSYNVVAKGLPAGLKLKYNPAWKNKKGKVVIKAKSEWWIEGVPTTAVDFFTNPPYLVITANGRTVTVALPVEVLAQDVVVLDDLALGQSVNTNGYLAGVTNGWTVSGLPKGLKYTAKRITEKLKSGKKTRVVTKVLPYSVYGKTTKAGLFTITAKKKVGGSYITKKFRVLVKPAAVNASLFGEDLTNITTMAYAPINWDLTGSVPPVPFVPSSIGGNLAKVIGLPTGLTFAAKDAYAYTNAKKKKGKYLKQKGQTIVGTPTKAGTYVVTFSKNVKEKVKGKMKTVAKTAQILWVVTQNDAELSLGFNTMGGVIESGVVGLKYANMMAFAATSNATVTASGLPAGIKLVKLDDGHAGRVPLPGFATWGFQGFTAKAGTYLVTVKATLNGKTITQRVALKVDVLPAWAKGTYNGYVAGEDGATNGLSTVTVSAAGKVSGKFYDRGTNWTFTAASYTGYDDAAPAYTVPIEAKFSYTVKEKVKVKGKWTTKSVKKSVARSFTLAVVDNGELGGTAMLEEAGVGSTVHVRQNLWGSTYKALGKALFSSKSGKKTLAYKTFSIKSTDPAGAAMGLLPTETLSLKVTTAGAVTATMSFDTGKRSKGKAVVYKATCSTVVIPLTTPDAKAAEFKGVVYLYFAPSTKNNFTGFVGAAPF